MTSLERGFVQIYTGDGKGKTTAALGIAMRARGFGLRVLLVQFMKDYPYSELKPLKELGIEVRRWGNDAFVLEKRTESLANSQSVPIRVNP